MRFSIVCLAALASMGCVSAHALDGASFRLLELAGSHVKWGSAELGRGATVTYAFATKAMSFEGARNCRGLTSIASLRQDVDVVRAETAKAFALWSGVANISFQEVADVDAAGIVIGAQAVPDGRAFANVQPSAEDGLVRTIQQSLVCLNPSIHWKVGMNGNTEIYDLQYTLAHEVGHAIGLDHPSSSGQLMAYRYNEKFGHLQQGDIAGAIALYGPRSLSEEAHQRVQ